MNRPIQKGKRSLRNGTLNKAIRLLRRLVDLRFGMTITEIAEFLEVNRRSVYRYLDAFKACGLAVEIPGRRNKQRPVDAFLRKI